MRFKSPRAFLHQPVRMETPKANDSQPSDLDENSEKGDLRTIDDVGKWLIKTGYREYVQQFADNEVDGKMLRSLTSAELRDDLQVKNLHHRRVILEAISKLAADEPVSDRLDRLPEHGRILDHLSNVRTYHSWLRVGVQFLSFSVVTLRLAPDFRGVRLVAGCAYYFAAVAVLAMLYAAYRYRRVIRMIEQSRLSVPAYTPDALGAASLVILIICAGILSIIVISLPPSEDSSSSATSDGA